MKFPVLRLQKCYPFFFYWNKWKILEIHRIMYYEKSQNNSKSTQFEGLSFIVFIYLFLNNFEVKTLNSDKEFLKLVFMILCIVFTNIIWIGTNLLSLVYNLIRFCKFHICMLLFSICSKKLHNSIWGYISLLLVSE